MMKIIFTQESKKTQLVLYQTLPMHYQPENCSRITTPKTDTPSTNAIETQHPFKLSTHCSQIIQFYDPSFFKYKICFQGFYLSDDYSLEITNSKTTTVTRPSTQNSWYTNQFIIIPRPMNISLDFRLLNNASVNECI